MTEKTTPINVHKNEKRIAETVADMYSVPSNDECVSLLVKAAIARRVKKRTGKSPARVYPIKRPR